MKPEQFTVGRGLHVCRHFPNGRTWEKGDTCRCDLDEAAFVGRITSVDFDERTLTIKDERSE